MNWKPYERLLDTAFINTAFVTGAAAIGYSLNGIFGLGIGLIAASIVGGMSLRDVS